MSANHVSRRRFVSLAAATAAAGPFINLGRYPQKMYDLTEALIRRGYDYGDDDIRAVLGGNFRRVLGEIRVA